MSIEEIRAKQVSQQTQAIGQRREAESIVRIGDRISLTGQHEVLDADGGVSQGGVKVYNSQEQYGDRVLALPRSDGTIALDSEKGSITRPPTAFPHCPGYLHGQVFNCEVPKKKRPGKIWVLYEYEGRIYVGGHQQQSELVYDPIPPNSPTFIRNSSASMALFPVQIRENVDVCRSYGQVWGDREGWEVSHGIKYPLSFLNFVTSGGAIRRKFGDALVDSTWLSGGVGLGKGLFIGDYANTSSGDVDNGSRTWKNAIVDFDGSNSGSGSLSWSRVEVNPQFLEWVQSSSQDVAYPVPYSAKTFSYRYRYARRDSMDGLGYTRLTETTTNSFTLLFRDRNVALFYRQNGSRVSGQYYANTVTDFLVTDGRKDTSLFSVQNLQQAQYSTSGYYSLFGTLGQSYNSKAYKFNSPSVTLVEDRSPLVNHQNSERDYDVRVFDIFKKESMIDGIHSIAKVSAWGIPRDAFIIDVAAWVP